MLLLMKEPHGQWVLVVDTMMGTMGSKGNLIRKHWKAHMWFQLEICFHFLLEVMLLLLGPFGEFLGAFGYLIENKYKLDTSNLLVFSDK
jgi:hypothetical protein